jgi:hypothetical protein
VPIWLKCQFVGLKVNGLWAMGYGELFWFGLKWQFLILKSIGFRGAVSVL